MSDQNKLRVLLITHCVCWYSSVWLAGVKYPLATFRILSVLPVVPVHAVTFSQASLIGIWAAFSGLSWWRRFLGLIAVTLYLELLFILCDVKYGFIPTVFVASFGVSGILLAVRVWRARILRLDSRAPASDRANFKFSVRGLMLFTLGIALLASAAKALRETPVFRNPIVAIGWGACLVLVALTAVWATLAVARPLVRSLLVFPVALLLGALFAYEVDATDWPFFSYIVQIVLMDSAILVTSLLIVRSCGFRLVRWPAPSFGNTERRQRTNVG